MKIPCERCGGTGRQAASDEPDELGCDEEIPCQVCGGTGRKLAEKAEPKKARKTEVGSPAAN